MQTWEILRGGENTNRNCYKERFKEKEQELIRMKKTEQVLKVIIGMIYAVVAAAWLIWVLRTTSNFAGVSLVMYFIPLLIML